MVTLTILYSLAENQSPKRSNGARTAFSCMAGPAGASCLCLSRDVSPLYCRQSSVPSLLRRWRRLTHLCVTAACGVRPKLECIQERLRAWLWAKRSPGVTLDIRYRSVG